MYHSRPITSQAHTHPHTHVHTHPTTHPPSQYKKIIISVYIKLRAIERILIEYEQETKKDLDVVIAVVRVHITSTHKIMYLHQDEDSIVKQRCMSWRRILLVIFSYIIFVSHMKNREKESKRKENPAHTTTTKTITIERRRFSYTIKRLVYICFTQVYTA